MKFYKDDTDLKSYVIPSFKKGYNSYTQSKSLIDDQEIPYGINVVVDDNGAATKRPGKTAYGGVVTTGKAVRQMAQYRTTSANELVVASGTTWKKKSGSDYVDIAGLTFTDDLPTRFVQAVGRLYGCNGTDKLAYYDGSTITEQTANGNVGSCIAFWNGRLYMNNSTYPDRIYYSNPYSYSRSDGTFAISDFGTFDINLSANPIKNAGYIMLFPGSGLVIKGMKVLNDYLYVWDDRHIWRLGAIETPNDDGSIAHSVSTVVTDKGTSSGDSIVQVGNDIWFYDYDNWYALGEQAQYQNIRISPKSGKIRSEIESINTAGRNSVVSHFFKTRVYSSYRVGSYNDRIEIYDTRMNAWSTPIEGINASCFLDFIETDGTHRLLAGSSNPADPYIYELETGSSDAGTAINGVFETKSIDCGSPGIIKRFAFIDVFYSMVYGTLTYEVFIDEVSSITGTVSIGNSSDTAAGMGSRLMGSFLMGAEYDPNTTFASLQQNSKFRIKCRFRPGESISIRFSNNVANEQFKINRTKTYYIEGSPFEE